MNSVFIDAGKRNDHFSTPMPLADALRTGVSGLEAVTSAHPAYNTIVEITPEKRYKEDHMLIVEPGFLNMFAVESVKGNAFEVLRKPYQCLLTESTAKKFYGQEDPIGKTCLSSHTVLSNVIDLMNDTDANIGSENVPMYSSVQMHLHLHQTYPVCHAIKEQRPS